jgi:hypothetical protein
VLAEAELLEDVAGRPAAEAVPTADEVDNGPLVREASRCPVPDAGGFGAVVQIVSLPYPAAVGLVLHR